MKEFKFVYYWALAYKTKLQKNTWYFATGAALFSLYCCTPLLMPPVESDIEAAKKHWPDASLAQLNEGHRLYKTKCTSCHTLFRPDKFKDEKWNKMVPVMGKKAKLDSLQTQSILRYILTAKETKSYSKK